MNEKLQTFFRQRAPKYADIYQASRDGLNWRDLSLLRWFPLILVFRQTWDVLQRLPLSKWRVLDIGCGVGQYAVPLAQRGAEVVALDPATVMIEMTAKRAAEAGIALTLVNQDFVSWSQNDNSYFDLVLAVAMLDYVPEYEAFLSSLAKSGNLIILTFPMANVLSRWSHAKYSQKGFRGSSFSNAQIERLLQQNDLEVIHRTFLLPGTTWILARPKRLT